MKKGEREIQEAIRAEIEKWPGATATFEPAGRGAHPKVKLEFGGLMLRRPYSQNSDAPQTQIKMIKDIRRALAQLGAKREEDPDEKAEADEIEKEYRKPNEGAARRPDPVQHEQAEPKPALAEQLAAAGLVGESDGAAVAAAVAGSRPASREDLADAGESEDPEAARAAKREEIRERAAGIVDGVYFDLPLEVYLAVERLNGSGLQRLAVSPATFWRGSWLDPAQDEPTDEKETEARTIGRAYHIARLEPEHFDRLYCRKLDKADFPKLGTAWNGDQIGAALGELGETKKRSTESVVEQAQRLEEAGFEGVIWPLEEARWKASIGDRIPISAKKYDEIKVDMERIREVDSVAAKLSGGQAEVSIFWTDPRYGIPMKARLDYLRPDLWDEFKTFDNSRGKKLRIAIADAMRYNRYHVQAVTQRDAVEAVRIGGLQIQGEASEAQRKLIAEIQIRPGELDCWFIFQEKSGVPNLLSRRFNFFHIPTNTKLGHIGASDEAIARVEETARTKTGLHIRALQDIDQGMRDFVLYSQVYRRGRPWAPIEAEGEFDDLDFNHHWLEGRYE